MTEPDAAVSWAGTADDGQDAGHALLQALVGQWPEPEPPAIAFRRTPGGEPAVVVCDLPPTGSGPLAGRRLAVKDNIAVAGLPTALGSGLPGFIGDVDATVVSRARQAGAQVTAKAQCEAFLLGANSFSSQPEPVRNPHDRTRSAGGSSSGSAVLVATGEADFAFGTDAGGSIRIPASHCGVVGFKPTRGRLPYTGIAPLEPFLEHVGPMARTVADASALFSAVDGADGADPRQAWSRTHEPQHDARTDVRSLRVGVLRSQVDAADPEVRLVLEQSLARLASAGAVLSEVLWPAFDEANELHLALYLTGQALVARRGGDAALALSAPPGWGRWRLDVDARTPAALQEALAGGEALIAADPGLHGRALRGAMRLAEELDGLMREVDVLILPVTRSLPTRIPTGEPTEEELYGDTSLTAPFNVTGHPALSLPAGAAQGLPVGMQVVGRGGADRHLLLCAAVVSAALQP